MPALLKLTLDELLERAQDAEALANALEAEYAVHVGPRDLAPGQENKEWVSWRNSLRALAQALRPLAGRDIGVLLEYKLPGCSKRIDAVLCGLNAAGQAMALVIELKQWSEIMHPPEWPENYWQVYNKQERNPGYTVRGYLRWLQTYHSAVAAGDLDLGAVVWMHNFTDPLEPFNMPADSGIALLGAHHAQKVAQLVHQHAGHGKGREIAERLETGNFVQNRAELRKFAEFLESGQRFVLLDEQVSVFQRIRQLVTPLCRDPQQQQVPTVLLISGDPGTGKTVVALQLLAWAIRQAEHLNLSAADIAVYTTRGVALTTSLLAALQEAGLDLQADSLIQNITHALHRDPLLLVCDEGQRMKEGHLRQLFNLNPRTRQRQNQVIVIFQDDRQIVRPDERGDRTTIRQLAEQAGWRVEEFHLKEQFRQGDSNYYKWVDNVLYGETAVQALGQYDLRLAECPQELLEFCSDPRDRLIAGFVWDWSERRRAPGDSAPLRAEVITTDWQLPWNRESLTHDKDDYIGNPYALWVNNDFGITQSFLDAPREVGCIYSAQGFDFRRCGVIIGPDLFVQGGEWMVRPGSSFDAAIRNWPANRVAHCILNTYRVLLTRGKEGTMIYVHNPNEAERRATVEYLRRMLP